MMIGCRDVVVYFLAVGGDDFPDVVFASLFRQDVEQFGKQWAKRTGEQWAVVKCSILVPLIANVEERRGKK